MNFIVETSDGNFSEIEMQFQIVKIPNSNTAFVFCNADELSEIRKLPNFVNVMPDSYSTINDFKTGLK